VAAFSDVDLNRLFDAALAFGPDWRRPVSDLAAENFPDLTQADREALAVVVEDTRRAIEGHIEEEQVRLGGPWPRREEEQTEAWIADRYPWMTRKNRRRARSQGQYYAWHDHG
jgi:hypothetical protein